MGTGASARKRGVRGVAVLLAAAVAGCTGGGRAEQTRTEGGLRAGGEADAKCVYVVEFEGRSYREAGDLEFTPGEAIGTGLVPVCDDGGAGAGEKPEEVTVREVEGVAPEAALAVTRTPGDVVLVTVTGADLPSPAATP
ncbi:DUF6281 family protein [Streptomyces sp. NPDC002734]|uniref:DUF6281 family protein n=1 Tax=Streptomyces sp. NPDC002734 TaxID=3154426 RepID=UPI00331FE368